MSRGKSSVWSKVYNCGQFYQHLHQYSCAKKNFKPKI